MRPIRTCESAQLNTGVSKCFLDMGKVKGAILVPRGVKLPAELTGEKLLELCHEDIGARVFPIAPFTEYAKTGGEVQANENGYGGVSASGVSARTDALTLDKFYPELNAALLRSMNQPFDVYYWDESNVLYGINDGTDLLAGFPMSTVYPTAVPHPTSSEAASLIVNFAFEDARASMEKLDFVKLSFNPRNYAKGLTLVELVKAGDAGDEYKLLEKIGGYDLTSTYGSLLADNPELVSGATAVTYDDDKNTLTLTVDSGATPRLKSPKLLFEAGIEGIEQL